MQCHSLCFFSLNEGENQIFGSFFGGNIKEGAISNGVGGEGGMANHSRMKLCTEVKKS